MFILADLLPEVSDSTHGLWRLKAAAGPVPIGIMTGWNLSEAQVQNQGCAFLLRKPFAPEELLATLSESLLIGTVSAEKEQCIRAYFKALSQRDWDALAALCAKDVTYHLPGTDERFSQLIRGREAFKAFSEETFESFPGAGFRVEALFPLPEGIIARYTGWWSAEPDRIAEVPGAIIFRFDENLISEIGVRVALRHLLAEMLTRPPEGESANPSPS